VAKFEKLSLMILVLCGVLVPSLFAQQVTTEMIGPLSGSFTINFPNGPCTGQDTITFPGNVHVSAAVDTTQNTVDYHINLLSVKGTGALVSKYVASGATDRLDQGFPGANISVPFRSTQICSLAVHAAPHFPKAQYFPSS
jgi:hypothetical protein